MIRRHTAPLKSILLTAVAGAFLAGCADESLPPADTVLTNGRIYTVDEAMPWAEAVAISDGKYVYVGDAAGAEAYVGDTTERIDLGGKMAMPGINDAHSHPVWGALKDLYLCNFPFSAGPEEIAAAISACAEANPEADWIVGGQWDSNFFKNHDIASPRKLLDDAAPGKAVYLSDDSGHNGWANTLAMEYVGITEDTQDPPDGRIEREPGTQTPNGVLIEGAQIFLESKLPDYTDEQYKKAVHYMVDLLHSFGLTGVKSANARDSYIKAVSEVDKTEGLDLYFAAALSTPYGHREDPLDMDALAHNRTTYAGEHVYTDFVKIFMDGVPTASRSAAMLAPYLTDHDHPVETTGMLHLPEELLTQDVIALDKAGYTVKIHTAGDRSVRVALNAIEAARKANGNSGLRHELAHAEFVDPVDLPRFAELGAVADLSPYIWYRSPITQSVMDAVGPRGEEFFPIKDYLESGISVLAGSDWPSAVPSITPWTGLEAMVTRRDPLGGDRDALWPEQAISVAQAIHIYTLDGARAYKLDDRTGSIEVGKSADLIVLNHNLFDIDPDEINETKILKTYFEGRLVYEPTAQEQGETP